MKKNWYLPSIICVLCLALLHLAVSVPATAQAAPRVEAVVQGQMHPVVQKFKGLIENDPQDRRPLASPGNEAVITNAMRKLDGTSFSFD